jgi:spore coat polysaccharide biosynthesis protein SpsF
MDFQFLIQARSGSTRLPKKVLAELCDDMTLLELVYHRVLSSHRANPDNTWILTTTSSCDDKLVSFLEEKHINYHRGNENDVFGRFSQFLISSESKADYFFRICCDNPFIETTFINEMTDYIESHNCDTLDYLSYKNDKGKPAIITHWGLFCEAIKRVAFLQSHKHITEPYQREHVTPIFYQSDYYQAHFLLMPSVLCDKEYRFTVDTKEDLVIIKSLFNRLKTMSFSYIDLLNSVEDNPTLLDDMRINIQNDIKRS